ncbi:sterile alpha motif domain-containing protein 10-like [Physella acuta]|uniref:sterile alpha motif domain-containing protein 10-like n=1 Tax=Physella acuta TaxID=109671 RepID=UPI0027DBF09F|nr:sterile alpha motif domain-containing protein 10-like [Physella acuta]XP_059178438.1 sterile alpha motif domain-containing protein 10-like [Physella acuta]
MVALMETEDVEMRRGTLERSPDGHDKIGATLEARPNKDGMAIKRNLKGKPKPLYFWNGADVNKWLRKHGGHYYELYGDIWSRHEVTGRTLIRMNEIKLEKMGILDATHKHDLMQFILRLRLKHEMSDIRGLNQRGSGFELKLPETRQSSMDKSPLLG